MLKTVLEAAQAKTDKEGTSILPEGRSITLYAAHAGVSLTVGKVDSIRTSHGLVRARNTKGEMFIIAEDDLFAAAIDAGPGSPSGGRKAGFLG